MSEKKTIQLAEFYQTDADYLNERIGELHYHAKQHEGELCSKLNRARIGGMIEVLSRMGLEVVCDWDSCTKKATIFTKGDFEFLMKVRKSAMPKNESVMPGVATEAQRASLQRMIELCDRPTGHLLRSTLSLKPKDKPLRGFWSSLRKALWPWKGRKAC